MIARYLRELGNQIHAVGGEQPHGETGTAGNTLHLKLGGLVAKFEGRDPLAIGRKPVFVSAFRIAAKGRDIKGWVTIQ